MGALYKYPERMWEKMVAQNMKRIMKEKGITNAALAEKTGYSKAAVSQYVKWHKYPFA